MLGQERESCVAARTRLLRETFFHAGLAWNQFSIQRQATSPSIQPLCMWRVYMYQCTAEVVFRCSQVARTSGVENAAREVGSE